MIKITPFFMMMMIALIAVISATTSFASIQHRRNLAIFADPCNAFPTCQKCVADELCGWCSTIDSEGFHCSGTDKSHRNNFTCNGVFSTETCSIGYQCDNATETCVPTAAGGGITKAACESECSPVGKLFKCNNQTYQCEVVPATTPGGQPQSACEASCKNPKSTTSPTETQHTETHAPASMSPHSHSPASHAPHTSEAPSTTVAPLFKCDPATVKCVPAKTGEAGSSSLQVCQEQCHHQNNTPSDLVGLWRGFPISDSFTVDEYDYNFSATGDVQYTHASGNVMNGKATFVETSFTITFTDNSQQSCLFMNQNTQPTTYEMIFACASGATPPSSVSTAMSGSSSFVVLASRCVDSSICQFSLEAGPSGQQQKQQGLLSSLRARARAVKKQQQVATPAINDVCSSYGSNCTYCLSHSECGWCSQPAQYNISGVIVPGTQCAGFAANGHSPWKCEGRYVSGTCTPGYACDAETQTCHLTTPGDGIPSMAQCEIGCKSKKGPPSQLIGKFRGIEINQGYQAGVWRLEMNATMATETAPDGTVQSGVVSHYAQYIFFTFKTAKVACIWSANTASGGLVEYITFACNLPGLPLPTAFDGSMNPKNGTENIWAKCLGSDCKW